jgi:hypothetical protein
MNWNGVIGACLIILACSATVTAQEDEYGPEVKSFLELMRHEQDELEFQIRHNEISRKEYVRSRDQLLIQRETVLELVRRSTEDVVPEIQVVPASELGQLVEGGITVVRRLKPGETIREKWKYLGSARRSEVFYIFERIKRR